MNIADPEVAVTNQDQTLRERIRAEVRALLSQRAELAHLEKAAAVREKTLRVAHDIRNPLATIQAVCGSLILETKDSQQRERLQLISNQVDQLASALAGALDGATDPVDVPTPVDVEELVRSLVNLLQYQAYDDLSIHAHFEPDLRCRLPQRGLTRSLYHLLRNAAEALAGRGRGEIYLDCRKNGCLLEIHVMDNGPGLPPKLFEQGLRAFSASRPDTALGLCSVERFTRGLGGRLELSNRDTGGARASMLLPVDWLEPG